jgi:hypothetical protein
MHFSGRPHHPQPLRSDWGRPPPNDLIRSSTIEQNQGRRRRALGLHKFATKVPHYGRGFNDEE